MLQKFTSWRDEQDDAEAFTGHGLSTSDTAGNSAEADFSGTINYGYLDSAQYR